MLAFAAPALATSFAPRTAAISARPVVAARAARAAPTMALAPPPAPVLDFLALAAKEGDFGGYILPVLGLTTVGIIIALLTPPVKD